MEAQQATDILGSKKLNYEFLMLVRDKKYPQALQLGKKILHQNPDNPSVLKFCQFIQANNKQLKKMVDQEKLQEQYESLDSDQEQPKEGQQQQQEQQGQQKSEEQQEDQKQQESQQQEEQVQQIQMKEKTQKKIVLTTCTLNSIPHICSRHNHPDQKNKQK